MKKAMSIESIEDVKTYFDEIGKPVSNNFLYGYEDPKISSKIILGGLAGFNQKYYIVAFFPNEIVLAPLTITGKFRGEYINISKEEIQSINVKKGFMQHNVILKVENQKHKLSCNHFLRNKPWQKENLEHLNSVNWYI